MACFHPSPWPRSFLLAALIDHAIAIGAVLPLDNRQLVLGVEEQSLQIEVPDGPEGETGQSNQPHYGHVARQGLRERLPVEFERHQQLRDNEGRRHPRLRAKCLAVPVVTRTSVFKSHRDNNTDIAP